MASSKDYLEYVLDLLSDTPRIRHRAMMGEHILYCGDKVFGGIYDDRFLVKQTATSKRMLNDAHREIPYPGGTPMLLVDTENRETVAQLVTEMVTELPEPKPKPKPTKKASEK